MAPHMLRSGLSRGFLSLIELGRLTDWLGRHRSLLCHNISLSRFCGDPASALGGRATLKWLSIVCLSSWFFSADTFSALLSSPHYMSILIFCDVLVGLAHVEFLVLIKFVDRYDRRVSLRFSVTPLSSDKYLENKRSYLALLVVWAEALGVANCSIREGLTLFSDDLSWRRP